MLASITPLGERGRNNRYAVTAAWHIAGAAVGGAAVGATAGLVGAIVDPARGAANAGALAVVVLVLLFELRVGGLALPTVKRQVNERWLDSYRGWVYGFAFGVQLGAGVVPIVTSAAIYAALLLAALTASVPAGALIGLVFGVVRGASVLSTARITDPEGLRALHRRMAVSVPAARRATVLAYAGLALSALIVVAA
jgi:hypothetical protein